jgi:hypothetical protein
MMMLGVPMLASCASNNSAPPPCPQVAKLTEASYLTRFAGPGNDLTDAVYEAKVDGFTSRCFYTNQDDKQAVRTELKIQFSASRAPKFVGENPKFQYFVAITGPNQKPLAREVFDVDVDLSGDKVHNISVDEIEPVVPLGANENGDFYRIYVGFILTEKELAYNRKHPQ